MRFCHRCNLTGLPGWMRFGYSPGWVGRSPTGLGPCAQFAMTGQWPTPQMAAVPQAGPGARMPSQPTPAKVDDNECLAEVKFECFGCPAAIACASVMTEMAKGKSLDEAEEITEDRIAEALGGLPDLKFHCSNLGAEALDNAIWDYVVCFTRSEVESRQFSRAASR